MRTKAFTNNLVLLFIFLVTIVVLLSVVTGFATVAYQYWVQSTDIHGAVQGEFALR